MVQMLVDLHQNVAGKARRLFPDQHTHHHPHQGVPITTRLRQISDLSVFCSDYGADFAGVLLMRLAALASLSRKSVQASDRPFTLSDIHSF
ncbi:hypothetical protein CS369_20440 [Candidatus Symbiopectobacterium sp. 'North America']|uniref:hypothetical protein n=1 Tax=Candidatus Symbiopectobacterium sp. 'North America' TaxID=2794574 RepID=UPI0018CA9BF6|nr:hypothetical protein [Candidatus Symbiopectobacterium sp. 'North America']MBG6246507.1 hypothetical protein [Candidatus Symbiopectobacterium sp. 'North America']